MEDTTNSAATMSIGVLGIIIIAFLLGAAIVLKIRANRKDER